MILGIWIGVFLALVGFGLEGHINRKRIRRQTTNIQPSQPTEPIQSNNFEEGTFARQNQDTITVHSVPGNLKYLLYIMEDRLKPGMRFMRIDSDGIKQILAEFEKEKKYVEQDDLQLQESLRPKNRLREIE